jgi:hypothetical protein
MCARQFGKNKVLVIGLVLMVVANTGAWWLRRHSGLAEDAVDLTSGLLYGLAIGTMIWGIVLQGRALRQGRRE